MTILLFALATLAPVPDAEVRHTMEQYVAAWLAGDSQSVMRLLTEDSVLIPNEKPPYVGKAAIRDYWFGGTAVRLTRFTSAIDQMIVGADIATVRGTQVIEWTSNNERWRTRGNYLTVLRRSVSGWRIAIQMAGNTPAEKF